jgi:hypothetical protein
MVQYLGRVASFLVGNTPNRFLGRRMHRSDFESMRAQLASPQSWNNALDRAREMSTWSTIIYQMRFGTTPQSEFTSINGWTLTNETGANHPADLDALTYQNDAAAFAASSSSSASSQASSAASIISRQRARRTSRVSAWTT